MIGRQRLCGGVAKSGLNISLQGMEAHDTMTHTNNEDITNGHIPSFTQMLMVKIFQLMSYFDVINNLDACLANFLVVSLLFHSKYLHHRISMIQSLKKMKRLQKLNNKGILFPFFLFFFSLKNSA